MELIQNKVSGIDKNYWARPGLKLMMFRTTQTRFRRYNKLSNKLTQEDSNVQVKVQKVERSTAKL